MFIKQTCRWTYTSDMTSSTVLLHKFFVAIMSMFLSIQERTPWTKYVALKLNLGNCFLFGVQLVRVSCKQMIIFLIRSSSCRIPSKCACRLRVFKFTIESLLEHVIKLCT
jgi:hypothetical protein